MSKQYTEVFMDEFRNGLSPEKWSIQEASFKGEVKQLRNDDASHVRVKNGAFSTREDFAYTADMVSIEQEQLVIRCEKGGNGYKGGLIRAVFDGVEHGKFEARAKLPLNQAGVLPRIQIITAGNEPYQTAFDLAAVLGQKDYTKTNLHAFWTDKCDGREKHITFIGENGAGKPLTDDFHVFTVLLEKDDAHFLVDGEEYFAIRVSHPVLEAFHQKYTIEISLSASSNEIAAVGEDVTFPQTMIVDYVSIAREEET